MTRTKETIEYLKIILKKRERIVSERRLKGKLNMGFNEVDLDAISLRNIELRKIDRAFWLLETLERNGGVVPVTEWLE